MTNLIKTTAFLICFLCLSFHGKAQQSGVDPLDIEREFLK